MILENSQPEGTLSIEGGLKTMDYRLDKASEVHLMNILRKNTYKDPILAAIREYWCNARDAVTRVKGDVTKDVVVSLPNRNDPNPVFVVKDYGLGLNELEVNKYYISYGASSKRDKSDETGCLGIGCKAAYAYGDSLSLVTVKNGVKRMFMAALNGDSVSADGRGTMIKISEEPTDERNSVEITMPVKASDCDAFRSAASSFFSKVPKSLRPESLNFLLSDIYYNADWKQFDLGINNWLDGASFEYKEIPNGYTRYEGHCFVEMGGVSYPLNFSNIFTDNSNEKTGLLRYSKLYDFAFKTESGWDL
jgi:hypothetical protein